MLDHLLCWTNKGLRWGEASHWAEAFHPNHIVYVYAESNRVFFSGNLNSLLKPYDIVIHHFLKEAVVDHTPRQLLVRLLTLHSTRQEIRLALENSHRVPHN